MIDPFSIGLIVLFLVWGALCFWVGRKPQQAKMVAAAVGAKAQDAAQDISAKMQGLMSHMEPGAQPLDSYADAIDMAMSIGAINYPGQVTLGNKIVKSGTLPGVHYEQIDGVGIKRK